ncbi:MAG TPA: hypothetical protein VEC37_04335 [Bacillota bacterium]|nr:hypothetical protein [Bacillota bacterium]
MGHQSQENNELKVVEAVPKEKEREKSDHPFLEKNDITLLSIVSPLLSTQAQKLVSFFINFGNNEPAPGLNINELISQFTGKSKNSGTAELLPSLLNMASNSDLKNALNPALLTTLFSMLSNNNNKKEE